MAEPLANQSPDLAVLASFSGEGGVERMLLNLLNAMANRNLRIHLLLIRSDSRHLRELHPGIKRIELGRRHSLTSLSPLIRYLKTNRPKAMLVAKDRAGRIAIIARWLSGVKCHIVVRLGTNLSAALAQRNRFQRWLRVAPIRWLYPYIDRIVAVSEGVREDTIEISGVSPDKVSVIRNPVITPEMKRLATEQPHHPWLRQQNLPVILGVGRLTRQKDFATLIRAFAQLQQDHHCRLIILGDGRDRDHLQTIADDLGVGHLIDMPGFTENPYAYMANARLFVLSSRWEGSPNVLTEAMVLGTPVVSTDCPSGPKEILDGGRYGPLVEMGDDLALYQAMTVMLTKPTDAKLLMSAVSEYDAEISAGHYLKVLGIEPSHAVID